MNLYTDTGITKDTMSNDESVREITHLCESPSEPTPMKLQSNLEINAWFNNLPVRILNSHEMPFFYAKDIADILGIKKIRKTVQNFDEDEIVSAELRKKYNIITYRAVGGKLRIDNSVLLLTEFGFYKLLITNGSKKAKEFRNFIYHVLYKLRTEGEFKIKGELQKLQITNELLKADNDRLQSKLSQFKNLCDELVLIAYENDPYKITNTKAPQKYRKKSSKYINPAENSVDHPIVIARMLAHELKLPDPCIEISLDAPLCDIKSLREKNNALAREFIEKHSPKYSYVVAEPTPERLTEGTVVHRVYVKNRATALAQLNKALSAYIPEQMSKKAHFYTCDKEKIIAAMDAISG